MYYLVSLPFILVHQQLNVKGDSYANGRKKEVSVYKRRNGCGSKSQKEKSNKRQKENKKKLRIKKSPAISRANGGESKMTNQASYMFHKLAQRYYSRIS